MLFLATILVCVLFAPPSLLISNDFLYLFVILFFGLRGNNTKPFLVSG